MLDCFIDFVPKSFAHSPQEVSKIFVRHSQITPCISAEHLHHATKLYIYIFKAAVARLYMYTQHTHTYLVATSTLHAMPRWQSDSDL